MRSTWDQLDEKEEVLRLGVVKNGEVFDVQLNDYLMERLHALRTETKRMAFDTNVKMHSIVRTHMHGPRIFSFGQLNSAREYMKQVCEEAGIPYLSPHESGRHAFATYCHNVLGMSANEIAQAGGWRDVALVQRPYIHTKVTTKDASDAMARRIRGWTG